LFIIQPVFLVCCDFNTISRQSRSIRPISQHQCVEFCLFADETSTAETFDCDGEGFTGVVVASELLLLAC
jgi:hypothetical protein